MRRTLWENRQAGMALAVLAGLLFPTAAAARIAPAAGAGGTVLVEGTSTVHGYTLVATAFAATGDAAGAADLAAAARAGGIRGLTVTIPVAALHNGHAGLTRNAAKALQGAAHPAIVFRLGRVAVTRDRGAEGFDLLAAGALEIAGSARNVTLEAACVPDAAGLRVRGATALLMTDYGVKPPVLMLGALKVGDRVRIGFDLTLTTTGGMP